ncbi:unnamed protein product, partial [Polarella glacialis]
ETWKKEDKHQKDDKWKAEDKWQEDDQTTETWKEAWDQKDRRQVVASPPELDAFVEVFVEAAAQCATVNFCNLRLNTLASSRLQLVFLNTNSASRQHIDLSKLDARLGRPRPEGPDQERLLKQLSEKGQEVRNASGWIAKAATTCAQEQAWYSTDDKWKSTEEDDAWKKKSSWEDERNGPRHREPEPEPKKEDWSGWKEEKPQNWKAESWKDKTKKDDWSHSWEDATQKSGKDGVYVDPWKKQDNRTRFVFRGSQVTASCPDGSWGEEHGTVRGEKIQIWGMSGQLQEGGIYWSDQDCLWTFEEAPLPEQTRPQSSAPPARSEWREEQRGGSSSSSTSHDLRGSWPAGAEASKWDSRGDGKNDDESSPWDNLGESLDSQKKETERSPKWDTSSKETKSLGAEAEDPLWSHDPWAREGSQRPRPPERKAPTGQAPWKQDLPDAAASWSSNQRSTPAAFGQQERWPPEAEKQWPPEAEKQWEKPHQEPRG